MKNKIIWLIIMVFFLSCLSSCKSKDDTESLEKISEPKKEEYLKTEDSIKNQELSWEWIIEPGEF